MPSKKILFAGLLVVLAVTLTYSNHFQNSFHFDDFHTVVENPYIRSLKNTARFFTDTATFSVLPSLRTYRPLVTLSLAIDYWMGGGLDLFYFHLDMFLWYLVQLALMFVLFRHILQLTSAEPWVDWAALFAVALYGLHPVMAETVNYIIQRGDLYSTLLVVGALAIFALEPRRRRFGFYLIPLALAMITKLPAAIFPAILFAYIYLFEDRRLKEALQRCVPSLGVVAVMLVLQILMTPATFHPSNTPVGQYLATQPWVALHYFLMFFAPVALTADTDQAALTTIFSAQGLAGLAFLAAMVGAIYETAKRERLLPVAFGLSWFLLALIPTSIYRLAEVENDHRMFFPFVGLALAVSWSAALLLSKTSAAKNIPLLAYSQSGRKRARKPWQPGFIAALFGPPGLCAVVILGACAWGTHQRNKVWLSEESLWYDVTLKSPHNGRGLLNYGRTRLDRGQISQALAYFEDAQRYTPDYSWLEVNMAVAYDGLRRPAEAEKHFLRAIHLEPADPQPHFYYGRSLAAQGRLPEAITQFTAAIDHDRDYLEARYALMQVYWDAGMQPAAKALATDTLKIMPGDAIAPRFLNGKAVAESLPDPIGVAETAVKLAPTAANYLRLSGAYGRAKRYNDCIVAAQQALKLSPDLHEAYNNIAAAHILTGNWDAAIVAANQALRLKPDYRLAQNNLEYAKDKKKLAAATK